MSSQKSYICLSLSRKNSPLVFKTPLKKINPAKSQLPSLSISLYLGVKGGYHPTISSSSRSVIGADFFMHRPAMGEIQWNCPGVISWDFAGVYFGCKIWNFHGFIFLD